MLAPFLKLLLGVLLILLPFLLMVHKVRQLLLSLLPRTPWREKVIKILTSTLCWVILEVIGLHLILDQLIPGQGTIYVHATDVAGVYPVAIENIAIEIVPVKFAGTVDFSRVYSGSFSKRGIYPALVLFGWGEHRVYLRAYDRSRPGMLLEEDYINVSPYVRVGFWDKHVYLNLSER